MILSVTLEIITIICFRYLILKVYILLTEDSEYPTRLKSKLRQTQTQKISPLLEYKLTWCWFRSTSGYNNEGWRDHCIFIDVRVSRETDNFHESESRISDRGRHCGNMRKERWRCQAKCLHSPAILYSVYEWNN